MCLLYGPVTGLLRGQIVDHFVIIHQKDGQLPFWTTRGSPIPCRLLSRTDQSQATQGMVTPPFIHPVWTLTLTYPFIHRSRDQNRDMSASEKAS
jgi:hypothetical protein